MLRIDLYTEITCPWCLIGQHRLDKVLAEQFASLEVDIRHRPVLLFSDAPQQGVPIADMLRSRYGITDPQSMFARPEAEARRSGIALDLSHQSMAYPTQAAHALVLAARERRTDHHLAVAISRAYFLDAKNIADLDALAEIAADHGFDRDEARAIAADPARHRRVEDEAARNRAAGVNSVPD